MKKASFRNLKARSYRLKADSGFTIIEMLVVLGILVLLTSTLVLYNRTGERHITVLREQARLIGTILRAKSFAINTYALNEPACGYGVHVADRGYFIYRDRAADCRTSDHAYGDRSDAPVPGTEAALDQAVRFAEGGITDIMFLPPDPQTYLDGGTGLDEGKITIETADGASHADIIISNAGQISG